MRYSILIILLLLTGCAKEIIVYKTKNIYKPLPKMLIIDDVNITEPIDKEEYIKATPFKREIILRNMIVELYSNVYEYKNKLHKIKKYDKYAKYIYESNMTK